MAVGHEKLRVYQKGMEFAGYRIRIIEALARQVAACDHLHRGSESILVNIAHASNSWTPGKRIVYLETANGSPLECAACLDILIAKALAEREIVFPGKLILREVVSMLIAMRRSTIDRVKEETSEYHTVNDQLFDHERLDVYGFSIQLVARIDQMSTDFPCSSDLKTKLDKSTTSIPLNIAEGNGRFNPSSTLAPPDC